MIESTGPWTLGTLIWLPIALVLVVALLLAANWLHRQVAVERKKHYGSPGEVKFFAIACIVIAVIVIGATAGAMFPYSGEYHQWRKVSGRVEQVSSRQVSDGKAMSQRYVVVIGGRPWAIDDTRAALLKEGDTVTLRCIREWQYQSDAGYACRWAS